MNGFTDVLAETGSRLTVPEPARSRILLELAADMEDLFETYVGRGQSEAQAREAVLEHFDLSDESLRELVRVHATPLRGMLNGLSTQAGSVWERVVLGVVVVGVALLLGRSLFQGGLFASASVVIWGVLAAGVVAVALAGIHGRRILGLAASDVRKPSRGVDLILGLAVLEAFLGFAGVWVELYRTALRLAETPPQALVLLVEWLEMAAATLTLTLLLAIGTALLWFLVAGRAARVDRQSAAALVES
jgi:hypothetical protein